MKRTIYDNSQWIKHGPAKTHDMSQTEQPYRISQLALSSQLNSWIYQHFSFLKLMDLVVFLGSHFREVWIKHCQCIRSGCGYKDSSLSNAHARCSTGPRMTLRLNMFLWLRSVSCASFMLAVDIRAGCCQVHILARVLLRLCGSSVLVVVIRAACCQVQMRAEELSLN